jgi:DNA-binding response OmpR family regulator
MLAAYFGPHGLHLVARHHAQDGMDAARNGTFDLVVLDVMLPGMDGFSVLRAMRSWSDVSVLLLTARGADTDRITGLESGADDYLAKPFNPRELVARIRAILRRRASGMRSVDGRNLSGRRISAGGVVIDQPALTVHVRDQRLELSPVEFDLLSALVESAGQVLSREDLMERVMKKPFHPEDRSLDMCVSRLRRKLDSKDSQRSRIKTIRSVGYLFSMEE